MIAAVLMHGKQRGTDKYIFVLGQNVANSGEQTEKVIEKND